MKISINALNAGELSPQVMGRVDLPNISKGARLLRNMLPRVVGGAFRRAGFRYLATAQSPSTYVSRLIPFNYSSDQHFVIELGNYVMRFIKDDALVLDEDSVIYEIETPWSSDQLFEIQFTQVNDIIIFAHADVPPHRLIRNGEADWSLTTLFDQIDVSQVLAPAYDGFRCAWTRKMDFTWVSYLGLYIICSCQDPKGHGLVNGDIVTVSGSSDHNSVPNGDYAISAVSGASFHLAIIGVIAPMAVVGTADISTAYVKVTTEVDHQLVDGDTVTVKASSSTATLANATYTGAQVDVLNAKNFYLPWAAAGTATATDVIGTCGMNYEAARVDFWANIAGSSLLSAIANATTTPALELDNDMTFSKGYTKFLRRITGTFIASATNTFTFKVSATGTPKSEIAFTLAAFPTFGIKVGGTPWKASPQTATVALVAGTRYQFRCDWFAFGGTTAAAALKVEVKIGAGAYTDISAAINNLEMPDAEALIAPFDENQWPAMQDENITATTMAVSAVTGTGIKLTASADAFTAENVGTSYQISHRRVQSSESVDITAVNTYTTGPSGGTGVNGKGVRGIGKWAIFSYGSWVGEIFLEQKDAAGAWETLRSYKGNKDKNIIDTGIIETETFIRLRCEITTLGTSSPRVELTWVDTTISGLVRCTAFIDARNMTCDVIKDIYATTATIRWNEGAWNDRRGYPRAVAIHQQRLIFGGTITQPQTFWGSVAGDFINFRRGLYDSDSYTEQLAATESSPIVWIASQEGIIIATEKEEWLVDGGSQGAAITPTSIRALRKSGNGAAAISPLLAGSVVLFVRAGGRSLLEYLYAFDSQSYIAPDLTQLAEHLTLQGIRQIAYQREPESRIWVVTNDGKLLSLTYKREQEVIAWAYHPTSGVVESVAVTNGDATDDVFICVQRTIGVDQIRMIEKLDTYTSLYLTEDATRGQLVYFDSAIQLTGAAATVWPGFGHLIGETISVNADGAYAGQFVVDGSGQITLDAAAVKVVGGIPYTSQVQGMPVEVVFQDGTMQGRKVKVSEVAVRFYLTSECTYRNSPDASAYPVKFRAASDPTGSPVPLKSEIVRLPWASEFNDTVDVMFETSGGQPLQILAIIPTFQSYG